MTRQAIVAGHVCLDVIPAIDQHFDLQPGRLYEVGGALLATGGVVSNTGVALHLLGVPTVLMGKVGKDTFGDSILDLFRAHDASLVSGMKIDPAVSTSYTVVINIPGVDRSFLHCPGANHTFTADDLDAEALSHASLFHFGYPPLMASTYADTGAELARIVDRVKTAGAAMSLDMAMPDPNGPSGKADWAAILERILPKVDIFLPSADELLYMIDRDLYGHGDHLDGAQVSTIGDQLLAMGVAIGGLKMGERGLYVRTAGPDRLAATGLGLDPSTWANRELWVPVFHVPNIVGATGAGDTTIAGFLAALLKGLDIEAAVRTANMVGAMNVQAADALSGLGDWAATQEALLAANPAPLAVSGEGWSTDTLGVLHGPADR